MMELWNKMLFENNKINVNMNGTEFIEFQNQRRPIFSKRTKKMFDEALPFLGIAGVFSLVYFFLKITEPTEKVIYGTSLILGYPISNGILGFLLIAMGFAWIFHGFGFIIIRR